MTDQYIITEEQLDWMKNGKKLQKTLVMKEIRSHPYNPQAEREKVLDELLERFDDDGEYTGWYVRQTIMEKCR